jgi:hypothetical protein
MSTMAYRLVEGIHVARHTAESPSNAEWDAYMADIEKQLPKMDGMLIYTEGGGPSAPQRRVTNTFWGPQPKKPPIAVVTTSKVVKILATTFGWVMGDRIRWFSSLDDGLEYLQISPDRREPVKAAMEELGASLRPA